jgi:hypothetical protein
MRKNGGKWKNYFDNKFSSIFISLYTLYKNQKKKRNSGEPQKKEQEEE